MMLEDLYRLLRTGHVQAQGVVDTMTQPIVVLDHALCVSTANNAYLKLFEVEREDILGKQFFSLGNGQWDLPELRELVGSVIPKAAAVVGFEVKHEFPVIGRRTFMIDARRLVHPDDNSTNILVLFNDVTERQRHDAEQNLIIMETRHRMKNLFAVVRSLAMQTETEGRSASDYRDRFLGRLEATLRAQDIAAASDTANFEDLLRQSVGEPGLKSLVCKGPVVKIPSSRIVPTSMIFHELSTNAAKYGCLSHVDGTLHVTWMLEDGPQEQTYLRCEWREVNGPPVTPPTHTGYGTELVEGAAAHLGGTTELAFKPQGLTAVIRLPVEGA